ncbi:transcriptional regulator [Pyrococcus abyssi]|uniref:Transcription regulator n=1 Tax=Pyrococcus abyssi (strain GE5 / Orsay) TaxID=272844 RepID=Q9UZ45_PYRAB|nr:transcriptional regulator [Pyrococcus abyssi]CAB50214.1 Hypothetical protein PAB3329 [Pyrococcus abyssi GE5]CCE70750.1 TPA: transcription regulator [Pyrococcus abyssi GE5]
MPSRREKIIELLLERDYSPSELARILEIKGKGAKKVILEDLKVIAKIAKREGMVLLVKPAQCRKCGFTFRPEINIPSRCPRCKSEWIEEPRFKLERK